MEDYVLAVIVMMAVVILSGEPSSTVPLEILKSGQQCFVQGKWYPANSSFVTLDCKMQCYCMSNGATSCMDLCSPLPQVKCPVGMAVRHDREPAGPRGSKCSCLRSYCAADFCYAKNFEKYKIGESFKRGNCSEICTCTTEGKLKCSPICPKIHCPPGFKRKDSKNKFKKLANGCSCPKQRCIPKRRRACKYNGRMYTTKRFFETRNCQSKCRCKRSGLIKCVPLCPVLKAPRCGLNQRLMKTHVPPSDVTRGRCQCTKHVCVPVARNKSKLSKMKKLRQCRIGNKTLVPGQVLVTRDCSDRCRCSTSGHLVCLPLCISPPVTCSSQEDRLLVKRPVRGSQCSCTRVTCRPKKTLDTQKKECKVDGHVFSQDIGEYIDSSCTKRCSCNMNGQAVCQPLCPIASPAEYCHNGYPQYNRLRVKSASWCSCVVKTCVAYPYNRSINEQ